MVLVHSKISFILKIMFTINIVTVHPSVKKKRDGEEFYKKEELILQNISTIVFVVTLMLQKRGEMVCGIRSTDPPVESKQQQSLLHCRHHRSFPSITETFPTAPTATVTS